MATSVEAPQQYKQPSRKGKRAWRKNVDVSDVQEGLEVVRDEVIKGLVERIPYCFNEHFTKQTCTSGIISEKPSDALFTLDLTGSEAIQKSYNRLHKPLKADQILAQRSAVPAIDSRKRSRTTDGVLEPSKRRKSNGVTRKEYECLKSIAYGGESISKDVIKIDAAPDFDPWSTSPNESDNQDPRFSYLEKPKPIRAPRTLKEAPISLAVGAKTVPAVAKPRPGTSYNPAFQDWDQLLTEEGGKEVVAEKKRQSEAEEEKKREDKIAAAQDEKDGVQTEDESAWEGFESEYENEKWLTKRRPERKTPAERNKVKRRKESERQAAQSAELKKRVHQAQQIRAIAKQVEADVKARASPKARGEDLTLQEVDDRILRRRKLGKTT